MQKNLLRILISSSILLTSCVGGETSATKSNDTSSSEASKLVPGTPITAIPSCATSDARGAYNPNGQQNYIDGSVVKVDGSSYQCKPYPYTGWCNGASWAYGPATGSAWNDAWSQCSSGAVVTSSATYSLNNPSKQTVFSTLNVTLKDATTSVAFGSKNTLSAVAGDYNLTTEAVADAISGVYLASVKQVIKVDSAKTLDYAVNVAKINANVLVPVTISGLQANDTVSLQITDNSTSPYNYSLVNGVAANDIKLNFIANQNVTITVTVDGKYKSVAPITLTKVTQGNSLSIKLEPSVSPTPTVVPTPTPTPTPTVAPSTGCFPAWGATATYAGGSKASVVVSGTTYNYIANYWNQGQNPTTNNAPYGEPWLVGTICDTNSGKLSVSLVNKSSQTTFSTIGLIIGGQSLNATFATPSVLDLAVGSYTVASAPVADAISGVYLPSSTTTVQVAKNVTTNSSLVIASAVASVEIPVTVTGLRNGDSVKLSITDNAKNNPYVYNQVSGVVASGTKLKFAASQNITIKVVTSSTYKSVADINLANVSDAKTLNIALSVNPTPLQNKDLMVGYLDATSVGGVAVVNQNPANYKDYDIVVIGFISPDVSVMDVPNNYGASVAAIKAGNPNAKVFFSVGGSNPVGTIANTADGAKTQAQNILAQLNAYKAKYGNTIAGFDFDVEQSGHIDFINTVTQVLKSAGYQISIAPQVNGSNTSSSDVNNVSLVTSGMDRDYNQILNSGLVDYVWTQNYNTLSFTIDGYNEGAVEFFNAMGKLLNNSVRPDCTGSISSICIPSKTKIIMGSPSSQVYGPNSFFNQYGDTIIGQANALNAYASQLALIKQIPTYAGAMVWEIARDVSPITFGNSNAAPSAFINKIAPVIHSN